MFAPLTGSNYTRVLVLPGPAAIADYLAALGTNETLNGGEIPVAKLLHRFPAALLRQERIS